MCDKEQDCNDDSDESNDLCKYSGKCGGNFNTTNGFLTSPSYPDEYPNNASCTYIISQPTNMFVKFTKRMFYINQTDCPDEDYLEIRDGSSEKSQLIGTFCGSNLPRTIQLSQNQLWMKWGRKVIFKFIAHSLQIQSRASFRFHSNLFGKAPGFLLEYSTHICHNNINEVCNTGMAKKNNMEWSPTRPGQIRWCTRFWVECAWLMRKVQGSTPIGSTK